jgi:hypothetical protein
MGSSGRMEGRQTGAGVGEPCGLDAGFRFESRGWEYIGRVSTVVTASDLHFQEIMRHILILFLQSTRVNQPMFFEVRNVTTLEAR